MLPVDPMNALQIRVSKLRRALRAMGVDELVTRDGVGYRASVDPSQVDALVWEVPAVSAVASTRGRGIEGRETPTNLPAVVRPLVGRDEQLASLASMLGGVRLISLVGPGGAGKTSLALATVVRNAHVYPDGAFGVRLASVERGEQVPLAVADALGVPLDGSGAERDVRQRLTSFLARRRMLLLVDNCEHVIDAAASLVDDILGRCPDVTVVATSREALAIPDEVQVTVAPLPTPPAETPPGRVLEYPAAGRHASYFREVAERSEVELRGHGQRATLRLLREGTAEHPGGHHVPVRARWRHRLRSGDTGSLGMFWHLGRHLEGREVLGRLVETADGSAPARARALQAVSIVERPRGCVVHPHPRCAETAEESLSIFTSLGDPGPTPT